MVTFLLQFADDVLDFEADLVSNKAAKFFETKKAEQKAATALAKQEASKSEKVGDVLVSLCAMFYIHSLA